MIYKIEGDLTKKCSLDYFEAHCRKLYLLNHKNLSIDISSAVLETSFNTINHLSSTFQEVRLYCTLNHPYALDLQQFNSLFIEYFIFLSEMVSSREFPPLRKRGSCKIGVTLFLTPEYKVDPDALSDWLIGQDISVFRFALSMPKRSQRQISVNIYKPLAVQMIRLITKLAFRGIRTEVRGPLLFCLFSDSELGILARECLPNSDYRTCAITLSINQYGTISTWDGPMQSLFTYVEKEMTMQHIYNFYKVRSHELFLRRDAFKECTSCHLKNRGLCKACFYYSPVQGRYRNYYGFYPLTEHPELIPYLSCRVHPDIEGTKARDSYILAIRKDRTLNSQWLNSSSFKLWELCSEYEKLSDIVEKINFIWGANHIKHFLVVIDQLQKSGFLILEPLAAFSQDIDTVLSNYAADTWMNI